MSRVLAIILNIFNPHFKRRLMDTLFTTINDFVASILFFDIFFGLIDNTKMPFLVSWLAFGGIYLTFKFGFVNLRFMGHAFKIIRGKYKTKDDVGEISSFESLSTALSATVGLGNIAGVAIAISVGGAGATFWMILAGFLGMSLKFAEVTLSQQYREFRPDGTIMGGAMQFLSKGLKEKGMPRLGAFLAGLFALLTIGGALGAGNAFQVNQAMNAVQSKINFFESYPLAFGILMAIVVGFVIIGGISRIASTASKIVPTMVFIYLVASLWIILTNYTLIDDVFILIFVEAFNTEAMAGGIVGVLIVGFQRAAFSSEAGIGSAAIAHSTARVKYPIRQGMVALYEPFIDTVIVCTMTAFVIIITGVYDPNGEFAHLVANKEGAALTLAAYGTIISWFPNILSFSIILFAFSTMISWSYYGERSWTYLFGEKYTMLYKIIFLAFTVVASMVSAKTVLNFSDLLLLSMAIPNLLGVYILSNHIKIALKDYVYKLKSGELDREAI
jgi:AGCS family alanine or glycine:cation symporter